ncbi:hypothetical protein TWF694_001035 [Orbilia ellipsospora]|uniref:Uncharacterized protein n=1 Tax=Orbilia ellipsospora TaxID=2528407 RepID=A0AAV9XR98_9PEZI
MATSATQSKELASNALASFLQSRHVQVPSSDASRALRRKHQRERRKGSRGLVRTDVATTKGNDASTSNVSNGANTKNQTKRPAMSKEERDIRQRILIMRENKRTGKPIIPSKGAEPEDSDDDF